MTAIVTYAPANPGRRIELPPLPPSKTPAPAMFNFCPGAPLMARYRRLQRGFEVIAW